MPVNVVVKPCSTLQHTVSKPAHHYVKLSITPHDGDAGLPMDLATLMLLLNKAVTEAFGTIGGAAISALSGQGLEIVSLQRHGDNGLSRIAILKVESGSVTPLIATLPFSTATENYSFDILGHSPSLALAKAAAHPSQQPGSLPWLSTFDKL